MNVLLLQPLRIFKRWPIPEDFTALIASVPTLALAQLAGTLPEHSCRIVDGLWQDFPIRTLLDHAKWADVVLINAHSSIGSMNVEANVRIIKNAMPDKTIIVGGHHATLYAKGWLDRGVDVVVRNEGERTLPELIYALEHDLSLDPILGITFRRRWPDGRVEDVATPDRPLIEDLDELPMPRWDLEDPSLYDLPLPRRGPATTIETSRGCHHACSFCAASDMWFHRQRYKSVERVVKELEQLKRLGYSKLWVVDDNYGDKPKRDLEIYQEMAGRGLDFDWMCFIRCDTVFKYPEAIAAAARAGLKHTLVGFEGIHEHRMAEYGKRGMVQHYEQVSKILRDNGIFIGGFFIVGYMGETVEETRETLAASQRLADYPIVSMFEPRMGTRAFDPAAKEGRVDSDPFYHNTQKPLPGQEPTMEVYRGFYRQYLSQPSRLVKLVTGTPVYRTYYRYLYTNLVRSTTDVSIARLRNPWEMIRDIEA